MEPVYIFSYGSLMLKEEAERTLNKTLSTSDLFPATLFNHIRTWSAIRDNRLSQHKWVVHRITGAVPPYIAYLNLEPQEGKNVKGMLLRINKHELALFDRREAGYRRIEVSDLIKTEYKLDFPVYTYIDQDVEELNDDVYVSLHYINFIRDICKKSDAYSQGILMNYLSQTMIPDARVDDLDVVYFNENFTQLFELRLDRIPMKTLLASVSSTNNQLLPEKKWIDLLRRKELSQQDWRSKFILAAKYSDDMSLTSTMDKDPCFLVQLALKHNSNQYQSLEDNIKALKIECK